jgi:sulfite reductase alpha subunit-like flavoprotein
VKCVAWHFGAAIKAELLELVQSHGKMEFEDAEKYLGDLMDQGRLSADLAD